MTSRLLSRRALGLGLVALVLMAAMVALGLWQLGVYDDHQHDDARARLERAPVPLSEVIGPDDAFPSDGVSRPGDRDGSLPEQRGVHRPGQRHPRT